MQINIIWTEEDKIRTKILASSAETIIYSFIAGDIMKLKLNKTESLETSIQEHIDQTTCKTNSITA